MTGSTALATAAAVGAGGVPALEVSAAPKEASSVISASDLVDCFRSVSAAEPFREASDMHHSFQTLAAPNGRAHSGLVEAQLDSVLWPGSLR